MRLSSSNAVSLVLSFTIVVLTVVALTIVRSPLSLLALTRFVTAGTPLMTAGVVILDGNGVPYIITFFFLMTLFFSNLTLLKILLIPCCKIKSLGLGFFPLKCFSYLFYHFNKHNSQRMYLVLVKWRYSLTLWEQLTDCLMLIIMKSTSRECLFTKESLTLWTNQPACHPLVLCQDSSFVR